jgi:hypothetical protein
MCGRQMDTQEICIFVKVFFLFDLFFIFNKECVTA